VTPSFRLATAADGPALDAIMHASNGYNTPEMRAAIESEHVPPNTDAYLTFVMEDASLCGFHSIKRTAPDTWELDLFFIANKRQGEGLGADLFRHAAAEAKQRGARTLVIVSNPSAADFYARMGATRDGFGQPVGRFIWPRPRFVLPL
jgi:predicted N-acetyltransferase YhbS